MRVARDSAVKWTLGASALLWPAFLGCVDDNSVAVTGDSKRAFVSDDSGAIYSVDLERARVIRKVTRADYASQTGHLLALSPDERHLFVLLCSGGDLICLQVPELEELYRVKVRGRGLCCLRVTRDGRYVLIGDNDYFHPELSVIDIEKRAVVKRLPLGRPRSDGYLLNLIEPSDEGIVYVDYAALPEILVFSLRDRQIVDHFARSGTVRAWARDGSILYCATGGSVSRVAPKLRRTLNARRVGRRSTDLALSQDGRTLLVLDSDLYEPGPKRQGSVLHVLEADSLEVRAVHAIPELSAERVIASPDGNHAFLKESSRVVILRTRDGHIARRVYTGPRRGICESAEFFVQSPDGRRILAGCRQEDERSLCILDAQILGFRVLGGNGSRVGWPESGRGRK